MKKLLEGVREKLEKVKGYEKSKKVKLFSGLGVILIAIVMLLVFILSGKENKINKQEVGIMDPELARAMTYEEVKEGDEIVEGAENVRFDAFFLRDLNADGYAESIRGTCKEIGSEDTLYMELNVVTAGYLKDTKIEVNGENFYLQTALPKDNELKDNYVGNNIKKIEFNDIVNGTQKMLTGIVRSGDYTSSYNKAGAIGNNINNYSKVNSVTLTGTYVGEDGTETPIEKTVNFNIDWYGTTRARIYTTTQNKNLQNAIDEENKTVTVNFTVYTEENDYELIVSKNHVEGEIPLFNGYGPISVEYTGNSGVFSYDDDTLEFTIDKEAVVDEAGNIKTSVGRSNSYNIKVVYPIEAYQELSADTIRLKIPVKTYYEGYNNQNSEFTNPYKSNIASSTIALTYENPKGEVSLFEVVVGDRLYTPSIRYVISKEKPLNLYNGVSEEEKEDYYTVLWKGYVGTGKDLPGMVMKETQNDKDQVTDQFIKTDSEEESMDEVSSNVGIYFSGADTLLGEDGEIKVYDEETDNLLVTFTKDNWNDYSSSNPYRYEYPVKHIRVETSKIANDETYFYVYNVKELDDNKIIDKYTREQFDNLEYIKSTLVGYVGDTYVNSDTHQAIYEAPISVANIRISKNTISTQTTEKNEIITIETETNSSYNEVKWKNGMFLVKLPEEIIDTQINSVEIDNGTVTIESYELIENEEGKFIKIVTKNENPTTFSIAIDLNISPDPRVATTTGRVELYASNENGSNYYYDKEDTYDVNNNLNVKEKVNYDYVSLSMVSPNSLLTNQVASNFDDKGTEVVSPQIADLRPQYAIVDGENDEEQTVDLAVQLRNNYASTTSEIMILGKIPFEGNTYVLNGADLGSSFTTKMTEEGIQVPEKLKEYVKVYYSENEKPNNDLTDENNGWKIKEEVTNFDNIKTYMIDLGDYVMAAGEEVVFNYTVKVPNGLEFNKVAYSHHGVYFCLDTKEGKYRTQTEPNKIGLRIAEKYDLDLVKYQTGKDKLVPGATYSITEITTNEEGEEVKGEAKTGVTSAEGKLTITNLYAEKEYEIREIKVPDEYELNEDVIRFIGHVDENGVLTIEKKQGTTREEISVEKKENEKYKVNVKVEDEAKASLKIIKQEETTGNKIKGVRFKITGEGLAEKGKTVITNTNGEVTIKGLLINREYTLEEVKAEGYYLASPLKFKISNTDGIYELQIIDGTILNQDLIEEDSIPTAVLTLQNEKIPTYDLELVKIKKAKQVTMTPEEGNAEGETEVKEYLEGAKFRLYKGTEKIGDYVTGSDGKVKIEGLYQYESDKGLDQTYTLQEILAPEGYAKVKDITFKAEVVEGALVLKEINEYGEETDSTRYTAEGNTISLTIEDSPSFKLIKKDAETKEVLAGIKFAIYNVGNGEVPARNSKGEIIGTKETIDGREYYTVTTDNNGEITADLPEGLYKAVEVEAPDKYDIEDSEYYFGIGASREATEGMSVSSAKSISGEKSHVEIVEYTNDGGYIVAGNFEDEVYLDNIKLKSNGGIDSFIIKYNEENNIDWYKQLGGNDSDNITDVKIDHNGDVIVSGYYESTEIKVDDEILVNTGIEDGGEDSFLLKYTNNGELIWSKNIGGQDSYGDNSEKFMSMSISEENDIIVGAVFDGYNINLGNGIEIDYLSATAVIVLKYNENGEIQWAKKIDGSSYERGPVSVAVNNTGDILVSLTFSSKTINLDNGLIIENTNSGGYDDGAVVKYNKDGEAQWAQNIGGSMNDYLRTAIPLENGGFAVSGDSQSGTVTVGENNRIRK